MITFLLTFDLGGFVGGQQMRVSAWFADPEPVQYAAASAKGVAARDGTASKRGPSLVTLAARFMVRVSNEW